MTVSGFLHGGSPLRHVVGRKDSRIGGNTQGFELFENVRECEAVGDEGEERSEPADDVVECQAMVIQGNQIEGCRDEHVGEIVSFSFICEAGESEEEQWQKADDDSGCQPCGKWHHVETLVDALNRNKR